MSDSNEKPENIDAQINVPNYIIIHGSFAHKEDNWYTWLYQTLLANRVGSVYLPQFPYGKEQNFDSWSATLSKYITNDTIIIAHSIAPVFVLKYLKANNMRIKKLISICGFNGKLGRAEYDAVNKTFLMDKIENYNTYCDECVCFYSNNDPYISQELLIGFAKNLGADAVVLKSSDAVVLKKGAEAVRLNSAGHINAESGYTKAYFLIEPLQLKRAACRDCGKETLFHGVCSDYYMVHDDVWQKANGSRDIFLCIPCLQKRLGRKLTAKDFKGEEGDGGINDDNPFVKNLRKEEKVNKY